MTDPTRAASSVSPGFGRPLIGRLLMVLLAMAVAVWGIQVLPRGQAAQDPTGAKPQEGADGDANGPAADEDAVGKNPFPGRFPAPGLEGGNGWLNTAGEITLQDLRGKIVLLDFWTYCCINCIHVLPDLEYLEEKYADQIVVIGVHSAKFENEKETDNIREAILRYEIKHPVINDSDMTLWRKYGVNAWPTLVVVDPEGKYVGFLSGEGNREVLDMVVGKMVDYHRAKGTLDETPVRFDLERHDTKPTPLRFPGKVLADAKSGRLFISDSNHNRIVIADLEGKLIGVIGTGAIGRQDGAYAEATFDHPQGMALDGETLYVADTENHLIRTVDLQAKTVSTLAGTGEQARLRTQGGTLADAALNSPWALQIVDGVLYIAMAGPHQMWSHRLGSDTIKVYAGSGREDILNGPLAASAFAQPSGLTTDGRFLYVCDSEGSAIRKVPVGGRGSVTTIAGTSELPRGRSLFEFGDVDGRGGKARLQHPLGIAYRNGLLYVADSYNHKIKTIDLKDNSVVTYLGDGEAGESLSNPVRFSEPSGLSIAGDRLFVADTNNHRLCVVNLNDKTVSELTIDGLQPPERKKPEDAPIGKPKQFTDIGPQTVAADESLGVTVELKLPEGYKLNELAPLTYRAFAPKDQMLFPSDQLGVRQEAKAEGTTVSLALPLKVPSGKTTLELELTYGYCRDGVGGLCKMSTARWRIPVEVTANAQQTAIRLEAEAK